MKRHLLVLAAAAATAASAPVLARDLVYGAFVSPKHGALVHGLQPYFKDIEKATNGEHKWVIDAGGQLANGKATPGAIRDGLMDAGFGLAPYVPNLEPANNLIFSTYLFRSADAIAATGAAMETEFLHCEQCLAELRKMNAVPVLGYDTLPYELMCRDVKKTVADLKGLKVRASAGGVGLMRAAGAVPVAMSPAQATTALQRGTVDCVSGPVEWIQSYGYGDVVKSVIDYPMGMAGPVLLVQMNRKTWRSFTPAQRRAYFQYAPSAIARVLVDYQYDESKKLMGELKEHGVVVSEGGKDFDTLVTEYDKTLRSQNMKEAEKFGVKNPQAILDGFDKAYAKWRRLSKEIGTSKSKFEDALRREIYGKVDPEKL